MRSSNNFTPESEPLLGVEVIASASETVSSDIHNSQAQHNYGATVMVQNGHSAAAVASITIGDTNAAVRRTASYNQVQEFDSDQQDGSEINSNMNQHFAIIEQSDETLRIYGYSESRLKWALMALLTFFTLGIFRLILHWFPIWLIRFTANKSSLSICNRVLVIDEQENITFRPVRKLKSKAGLPLVMPDGTGKFIRLDELRFFTHRKISYLWHPLLLKFAPINQLESELPLNYFHSCVKPQLGLLKSEVEQRIKTYGRNAIEVKLKPIYVLLFKEVITPFYIFQLFSVTVWYNDNYAFYASIIVLMSVISIVLDVFHIRKQEKRLRSMVHTQEKVHVMRDGGQIQEVSSDMIVPGDIILIPPRGCVLHCDAVLMTGTVIVNEAMLTGESMPITKVALVEADDEHECHTFSFKEHSKHVLYCGTQVLQTRYYRGKSVQAVVLRTAYSTLKGQLVRSIMYPKPVDFRFTKDLFKFVGFLACIAGLGFMYTIAIMAYRGSPIRKVLIRSLDIITVVVPPALPAAMSIGILAAQMRLLAKKIFCISPSTINTCGAINAVCFDKTGTLTEDGLDFTCFRAVFPISKETSEETPELGEEMVEFSVGELPNDGEFLKAVATCHSLTRIDNVLTGDPMDLILFRKTGWIMDEGVENIDETQLFDILQPTMIRSPPLCSGNESDVELAVIRQFTFSSSLQRMSVIVHNPNEASHTQHLYCKGAPEKIASLCVPSTIPQDFQKCIDGYAQYGYRLIAVASRCLQMNYVRAQKIKREHVECELTMLGIIVMENRLKEETTGVINQLNKANIRTIMVTGDNLLTAMSVARECGIIRPNKRAFILETSNSKTADGRTHLVLRQSVSSAEDIIDLDESISNSIDQEQGKTTEASYHLAISGYTFSVIYDEYEEILDQLVCVCDVYARMSPEQKQMLVNTLQQVDYTVAMCGDGANDCAALKAAHAGISLSEAEASIAAPFTSKIPDIRCVPMIIREGRAALVTSFGIFKYMAGYSLTQFITIMQLYWLSSNLTDFQFLYIDLALITLVALFFGYTPSCEKLSRTPPPTQLLSMASVFSILGQLAIISSFQVFIFVYTAMQPWFVPYEVPADPDDEDKRSMQGTSIFCVSMFQYITLAVIYSKGFPYRKSIFSNKPLCLSLLIVTIISIIITVEPPDIIIEWLEFDPIPYIEDRLYLLVMGVLSGVFSYLYETFIIEELILNFHENRKKRKMLISGSRETNRFDRIVMTVGNEPNWLRLITSRSVTSPNLQNLAGTNRIGKSDNRPN